MIEAIKNNFSFNKEVNICLNSIIKKKLFANGYIFYGAEGVGKNQAALQFIKEIFKQSSPIESVEEKIKNNNHPDFLIIKPNSLLANKNSRSSDLEKTIKSGSEIIKIAQIRNIKTFLGKKSINSEKKIVLIIDAHLLNEAASNCLLKTLEEPNNGIFILLASKLSINTKLKFEDLINSSNGSPNQLLKNIEIWNDFSEEIISKLDSPIKNSLELSLIHISEPTRHA